MNTILYGPPGTGKTYKTAELAVEICGVMEIYPESVLMERYEEFRLKEANQLRDFSPVLWI